MSTHDPFELFDPLLDTITISANTGYNPLLNGGMSSMNSTLNWSNGLYNITTSPNTSPQYPQYTFNNIGTNSNNTLQVTGEGADVLLNGKSLKTFMEKVEERLLILQPDPAKLEKYAALRKAYDHYKLLEKLIQED